MIGFGLLDLLEDPEVIIALTFVFQILGGCGTGMIIPSSMAIVSCYKDRREEFIGHIELCSGLGALCGPLFGACFYMIFGYMGPFECIGGLFAVFMLYFFKKKNAIQFSQDTASDSASAEELKVLSFVDIISIPRSGFGLAV